MTVAHNNPKISAVQDRGPPLTYGCVCSGISAPTLAAKPLGWKAKFFSELEAFPRAVLSHHYPQIPLHGDFTTINGDTYGTVDILIGGTPCQSFSVAGKRLGLDDPRGNLALEYVRLAERLDAQWMVFENVPGLLSNAAGKDFAVFISAVTGHEYGPPATGWQNSGIAAGKPGRFGIAWRILDAQYFGVAQRRRRLFVVGYRGDWRPAAAVLFESESVRGNPPPSRSTGKAVAALTATGVGTCGADDNQGQAGHLIPETAGALTSGGNGARGRHLSAEMAAGGHLIPYNIIRRWSEREKPRLPNRGFGLPSAQRLGSDRQRSWHANSFNGRDFALPQRRWNGPSGLRD
jgi:DNA (cytosine-5)-methyltransferase 1